MKIYLTAQKTVREVKKEFNKSFPFLKIEFFKQAHGITGASSPSEVVPGEAELIEVTGVLREGSIEVSPRDTVSAVEQRFQHGFGLPVQVFRKQKGVWLETTQTDHITLDEQNEMGIMASALMNPQVHESQG